MLRLNNEKDVMKRRTNISFANFVSPKPAMAGEGGVYYTKFECILKAIPTKATNRTLRVCGGSKLPRTLVSFRHCLAEPRQPRKKNTPC
ncbi:MAG: hypothetical protein Q7S08_00185, partial [bacterium]|nr:hypothetical protein [bacterium]